MQRKTEKQQKEARTSEQQDIVTNEIEKHVNPWKVIMKFNVERRPRRRSKALKKGNTMIHDLEEKLQKSEKGK